MADYAGIDEKTVNALRDVLRAAIERMHARALPVPISHRHGGLDARTNRTLLRDIEPDSDGGATLRTSRDVIRQVGRCRVVVTGSYHAGVFALAQGLPVVALVNSMYYADKFRGLADMFGGGCEIVSVGDDSFGSALSDAIARTWASAEQVRPGLLAAAATQVQLGHDAYRELESLVEQPAAFARG
jgi:polysaccharide pyruvyl transferase WcaK-like protein